MAKFECTLHGDFHRLLDEIETGILGGSASASLEDGSDYTVSNINCAVRVYERYSLMGSNRVSLNVTLVGNGDDLFVSAITAGGSQAVVFKINTFGESSFLDCFVDVIDQYKRKNA